MRNVPDDWDMHYYNCFRCNSRFHASEGGCNCLEDHEKCVECKDYYHIDDLLKIDDRLYCDTHAVCEICEEENTKYLNFYKEIELLICKSCKEKGKEK